MKDIIKELREIKQLLAAQKRILTLDEFCLFAGISKSYAYHLTSSGKVKCYRPFGKMIFFDVDEVIECLKQNQLDNVQSKNKKIEDYFLKNKKV
jgi:predicted DNA-binding transcriptional regulator AlpA